MPHPTELRRAELRLQQAEQQVRAAREALDALTPPSREAGYDKLPRAPLTHEMQVSDKQLHILVEALEFYSRWCMGHFVLPNVVEFRRWPATHPYSHFPEPKAGRPAVEDWDHLHHGLDRLRALLFPEFTNPGAHYGVGWNGRSEQQHLMIAYELRKAIVSERNQRLGINNTDTHYLLHYSDQPRAQVRAYDPAHGVAEWQQFLAENAKRYPTTDTSF